MEKTSIADLSGSSNAEQCSSKTSPLPKVLKADGKEFLQILLPPSRQWRFKFRGILCPKLL